MKNLVSGVLLGGFAAGTIDIGAACLIYHIGPSVVLQSIAGGLVGAAAHHGGLSVSLLGLGLQWAMSLLIAAIYGAAALRLQFLLSRPLPWGLAYGVAIFVVMNYVVMPLSAIGHVPRFTVTTFALNLLAMLAFGLIVSFSARWLMVSRKHSLYGAGISV